MRTLSGIQPTGSIHLGNYLGAIKNWVSMQNNGLPMLSASENESLEHIFCVVNSHAITVKINPQELKENTLNLVAMLLACGIDSKKSTLFVQSEVDYHPALAWILQCHIPMGDLSRMTQFKDKSSQHAKNVNAGLFSYPALMAADILLYDAKYISVGADQKQHLELSRDVAQRFNNLFKTTCFTLPHPLISEIGARVMGLDNPEVKMSKSNKAKHHAIFLLDDEQDIIEKIKKAKSDNLGVVSFKDGENRAGIINLLGIYQALSGKNQEEIENHFATSDYARFKSELAELIISELRPIKKRYFEILKDSTIVHEALKEGAQRANEIAAKKYKQVKEIQGLI